MLREAVAKLEAGQAPLALAHALLELGSELRHQRRAVEARAPLTRAEQIATRCDAAPLCARAVVELAAEGLTNREIAQRLYVSVKTIETQLSSSFRELQITSRKQLPTALERLQ